MLQCVELQCYMDVKLLYAGEQEAHRPLWAIFMLSVAHGLKRKVRHEAVFRLTIYHKITM